MNTHQLWAGVVIVIATLASFVTLALYHIDAAPLVTVLGVVVTPIVTGMIVVSRVAAVSTQVDSIDKKVNGHLTALTSKIPDAPGGPSGEEN